MKDKITGEACQKVARPVADPKETNLCKEIPIPMIETHSFLLPTTYSKENQEGYSKMTNVTLTGEWYKSSCAIDFGGSLSKVDTPFTSLVSTDKIEIIARSRDISANGTMSILFEQLEVVC
uniref:Uncharacterized protein n=1 Tax=Romanomermis culicivorax TaxID=13658 RepID=A0A915IL31_ROMCU